MSEQALAHARWIRPDEPEVAEAGQRPAHLLGTDFEVDGAELSGAVDGTADATLSVTAHGLVEVFLNGQRVGEDELVPGFTAYRKRLQVFSYPVGPLLRPGLNRVEVLLSDGWFRGRHGFERRPDGFGAETALLLQLDIRGATGTDGVSRVVSDATWQSRPSHITRADLMDGQTVDFRLLDEPAAWHPVSLATGALYDDRARLVPPSAEPVRRIETLPARAVTVPRPGTAVIDFGQNINGWVRLAELGPRGTHLTLTHGEVVDATGFVTTENLRAFVFSTGERLPAGQIDEVVSAGRPGDVFEPRHTTHGFRYVQIDGLRSDTDVAAMATQISAVVVHSALRAVGSFSCSDERLNALHEIGRWSFRGNACDIPTDCPQRERSGFTGDWQIFIATATLLYDVEAFSSKWLADLSADQWPDGRVPTVVPNPAGDGPAGVVFEDLSAGSAGWGDAAVLVPWEMWRSYGDLELLRRQLPSMLGWVRYAASAAASARHPDRVRARPVAAYYEDFLWDSGFHFGEWLEPGVPPRPDASADHSIVATAFLHRSARLAAAAAELVGEREAALECAVIAAGALEAWQREFVDADGRLSIESQANYARGIAFELFPARQRAAAAARLAELLTGNADHLSTGFLSTGQLLPALADHGQIEAAYRTLLVSGAPSWLEMIERGATTVWEWWDGVSDDDVRGSLNHYSKAAVLSFLYTHVAGIRQGAHPGAEAAGWRRPHFAPLPGGSLTAAQASVDTPLGRVSSDWRVIGNRFELDIEVPPGAEATVELPDGSRHAVAAGRHAFSAESAFGTFETQDR